VLLLDLGMGCGRELDVWLAAKMFEAGENALKLHHDCLQFGVYVARVASLVLIVIAQCAQLSDHTL
jgi:membrane-associated PAP2 superfamily phosphatase